MRPLATTLTLLLLLVMVAPASAQFATNWNRSAGTSPSTTPSFFGGTTERGFAYGLVGGNERVYVPSRNGGNSVRILNGATGADIGTLDLTGVTGGLFVINDAGVSDDGVIFVCNLTIDASASPFKCYTWATEGAVPSTALSFSTATDTRFGDKITVSGSCSDNSALIWAVDADGSLGVYKFGTADNCATFTQTAGSPIILNNTDGVPAGSVGSTGSIPDVAPLAGGGFWQTGAGNSPRLFSATGDFEGEIPGSLLPTGTTGLKVIQPGNGNTYLITNRYGDGYCQMVDVTNGPGSATALTPSGSTPSIGTNSTSGNADVDVKVDGAGNVTVYCMSANNGVASFTYTPTLPVELTAFEGTLSGNAARLAWATASETNNAGFYVEHSANGSDFRDVHFAPGHGTTLEARSYDVTVADLAPGTHTFRLRQTDLDGASELSHTVELTVSSDVAALSVAPNPSRGLTNVSLAIPSAQQVTVSAYDVTGRLVTTLFSGAADTSVSATLSDVAPGVYVIIAEGETFRLTTSATVLR